MTARLRIRGRVLLTGVLLILGAGTVPAADLRADLHVDAANGGAQDGTALHPFKTVQKAIDAAKGDEVIAVAAGTYPQNIKVADKAVRLYGGYVGGAAAGYAGGKAGDFATRDPVAHPTHLKGDGKDSVVTMSEAGASVVDGFVVSGGGRSVQAKPAWLGGGFYIFGGSPTISNNVIEKNRTCPPVKQDEEKFGGGIYFTGPSIAILDNVIRENVSGRGAGVAVDARKVVVRGNTVQGNVGVSDHGGGLHVFSENAEISRNRIVGNEIGRELGYGWGGGIIVFNKGGKYKLSRNVFTGNYAPSVGSAVFVDDGAVASLDHDLIYANPSNPAADGVVAPVYVDGDTKVGSTLDVNHVTIADHTSKSPVAGTAISLTDRSKVVVRNSILWNNGGDITADKTCKATVSYTLTQKPVKGTDNVSGDPLFADPAAHDYRLRSNSPAIGAAEPAPKGGRANLGADGDAPPANKRGKDGGSVKKPDATAEAAKTYLLRGTTGEMPSEVGDDATKLSEVASKELGGKAVQVEMIDTFGQRKAAVEDWTAFDTLRLDIANQGAKDLEVEFNLFHSGTTNYATRAVVPFTLKPGKNEVRIAIKAVKNTNGTPAKLAEVRRWYVSTATPAILHVGDIYLEGKAGGGGGTYTIKTDPARLERIKAAKVPKLTGPVAFNTKEADVIMAAANLFPADNPWNTLVEDWPVHPNSKKIVASIGAEKPLRYNQDMAFVIVPPGQKKVEVKLTEYPDESDPGPYPVADDTPIEGWPASFKADPKLKALTLDDVQRGKPTLDADRHAVVYDPAARKVYEFYRLTKTDKGWHADQASVFDLSSNKLRPDGWTSTDAAGLPILPAIARYDEIQRGVIDHALRFTVAKSRRGYVYPATHFASKLTDEDLPRMGERFRLRKDFDTSKFTPEARVILEALKRYGMLMADNGMDWGLSVSADDRLPAFHDEFRKVKGSDFEVVTPPPGYVAP